jgi:type I restriction enzyme S subunit
MNEGWEYKELGEVIKNTSRRFDFKGKSKVVFINTGDVFEGKFSHENLSDAQTLPGQAKKAIKRGDILFSEIRPANGRFLKVNSDVSNHVVSTKFMVLTTIQDNVSIDYVYKVITSKKYLKQFQQIAESRSGTFPQITFDAISYLPISFPDYSTQQRIIAHINGLDQKIALLRQQNATLESMAQALFKSWFVDFDPVIDNALAAGRALPEALAGRVAKRRAVLASGKYAGLPEEVRGLFPEGFVFSEELGRWVPEGWEVTTLGNQFDVEMGQSPPGSTYNEIGEGIPFYQGSRDFGFRFPTPRVFCTAPKRFAKKNDTLISVRAPVGDANLAMNDCCIGRGVGALKHKSGSVSYTYYYVMDLSVILKSYEAGGTVFGSINQKQLKSIEFCSPSSDCIKAFESKCSRIDKSVKNNTKEIQTLTRLRDVLLPELISGRLGV